MGHEAAHCITPMGKQEISGNFSIIKIKYESEARSRIAEKFPNTPGE